MTIRISSLGSRYIGLLLRLCSYLIIHSSFSGASTSCFGWSLVRPKRTDNIDLNPQMNFETLVCFIGVLLETLLDFS